MKKLWDKYREIILYIVFGVLTTLVSWIVYFVILKGICAAASIAENSGAFYAVKTAAQVLQWIAGVLFAFFTNKKWVFRDTVSDKRGVAGQLVKFSVARLGTFGVDTLITFALPLLLSALGFAPFRFIINIDAEVIAKIAAAVVVIILNYIFSKLLVFREKKAEKTDTESKRID